MNNTKKLSLIDALYARLPRIACQQRCQVCCGPIAMSRLEFRRLLSIDPTLRHKISQMQSELGFNYGRSYLIGLGREACSFLRDGACSIYSLRPLICRLWGMTQTMRCPWGCQPERFLNDREAHEIMGEMMHLGL